DGFGYGKKQPPGLSVKTMSFNFGKPNSKEFNWLDNVLVTEGEIVGDFDTFVKEGAAAAKAKAERIAADKAAQTLTLAEHQVLLSPEAIDALKRSYKPDGVTAHLIMTVGADAAKALDHWTPLTRKELKDCKIVDKFSSTLQNADMEKIKARALEALAKFKPETVTILPGTADLAMNKTAADVATQISELADAVIEAGAVPILYTPAISNRGRPAAEQADKDLAEEVRKLAVRRKLPLVDAFAIINPDGVTKMSWVSGANPNMSGHEAINKASLLLYARLDQYLYGRKPGDAGGAKDGKSGDGKQAGRVADEE
ncbi:MAG: SGNH/GDSL hydrolase family protein, partial [Planctomycetota bacterium]|nr:SGNH/GDSL hydrolase family protein [Planctomycetota bacterium]